MAEPQARADALAPLAPGPLLRIADGALAVEIAPEAGGRIAQIRWHGEPQLVGHGEQGGEAAIAWGCYPMMPWCGRIRAGRFRFGGQEYVLPPNLGGHAIHGTGFVLPWQVRAHSARQVEMTLDLPCDARWPFGGRAAQRIAVAGDRLELALAVTAGERPMPASLGWHPWFRKPLRLQFDPEAMYPRDEDGITRLPPGPVAPGPWDDCFVNHRDVVLQRADVRVVVSSDCTDWVVYDATAHATCVEPQTAPPDAFNLDASPALAPGQTLAMRCELRWEPV